MINGLQKQICPLSKGFGIPESGEFYRGFFKAFEYRLTYTNN